MTMSKKRPDFDDLDAEERAIQASVDAGEWETLTDHEELDRIHEAARNTMRKSKTVTLRFTPNDLLAIKAKAADEGMPYQTLISSVMHKYVTGQFDR